MTSKIFHPFPLKIQAAALLLAALLLFPGGRLAAQNDSLPRLAKGRMSWAPYAALAPKRMNQKDYAVYMVRMNGLHEWFESEPDQAWVNDFHFFDLNGDRIPDGVYSGTTHYFKGDRTMLMLGDSSLKYPLAFSEPGYVQSFIRTDSGIHMTLVQEPFGLDFRVYVREYFFDYAADSARQKWETQYISTTEIPQYFHEYQAFALKKPTYLRTTPEVRNEPAIDYDQDGRPDGLGNIVAELKPGMPLFRLAEKSGKNENWSFVLMMQIPEGKHQFQSPLRPEVPAAFCGWIPSEAIGQ